MKNDSHPLIQALKKRSAPVPERLFEVGRDEIPFEKNFNEGDNATFGVHGRVKSRNDDGSMTLFVHRVEHQKDSPDVTEVPRQNIITTQQSHAP